MQSASPFKFRMKPITKWHTLGFRKVWKNRWDVTYIWLGWLSPEEAMKTSGRRIFQTGNTRWSRQKYV